MASETFFNDFEEETVFNKAYAAQMRKRGHWGETAWIEHFDWHANRRGGEQFIVDDDGTMTWDQLRESSNRVAAWLQDNGVDKGDRVAYLLPQCTEWYTVRLGITRAGGIAVPMNTRYRNKERRHILTETEPTVFIGESDYKGYHHVKHAIKLRDEIEALEHIITRGDSQLTGAKSFATLSDYPIDNLNAKRIHPDYPDSLSTTSGTTSLPKLHYRHQNSHITMARDFGARFSVTKFDNLLVLPPIHGGTGEFLAYFMPLLFGNSIVLTESTDPKRYWTLLNEHKPDFLGAVPTQMTQMMNTSKNQLNSLSFVNLVINGGSPLPQETAAFFEEKGTICTNLYGTSDGGAATAVRATDPEEIRRSTTGKPLLSMEVRIVDGNDVLPPGEVGEVIWRGGTRHVGYFRDRKRTEEKFGVGGPHEGWFHSGDLGVLDINGNLKIVGRVDDMIVRGGRNIFPAGIENEIMKHKRIDEAAVVGYDDPVFGQRACAFIVVEDRGTLSHEDLIEFLDDQGLARYKWPERIEVLSELPRTAAAKINKPVLKNEM